jgi:hypothetical protein
MRWMNDEIRYYGPYRGLMDGYRTEHSNHYRTMWGIFRCGHAQAFLQNMNEPYPVDMHCPVCDEGHVVPPNHIWSSIPKDPCPVPDPRIHMDLVRADYSNPPLKVFDDPRPNTMAYNASWGSTSSKTNTPS